MTLSYLNVISVIILFQLALLVLFLVTSRRGKAVSNRLLALFFVLLIINLADGLLTFYGFYTVYPSLAHLEDGFVFLLGPTIYLYTRTMIYHDFRLRARHLLHGLPFVLTTVAFQLYYHFQSSMYQQKIQDAIVAQDLPPFFYFSVILIYIHVFLYVALALRDIHHYRFIIRERFSHLAEVSMNWLLFMLWSIVFILVVSLIYTFLPVVGLRDYFNLAFGIGFFIIFFFINAVVWKGLHQPEIFAGIDLDREKKPVPISPSEKVTLGKALSRVMNDGKVYLESELTLDGLAGKVGFPPRKVSQFINEDFRQNFFDYINTCRVAEAERIFRESLDPKLTILEVMYASGFNSKSSFNTIFKQKTGLTPSEYRRQHAPTRKDR
jgi:AraC-like DNA-binding protein